MCEVIIIVKATTAEVAVGREQMNRLQGVSWGFKYFGKRIYYDNEFDIHPGQIIILSFKKAEPAWETECTKKCVNPSRTAPLQSANAVASWLTRIKGARMMMMDPKISLK